MRRPLVTGLVIGVVASAVLAGLLFAPLLVGHRSDFPGELVYGDAVVSFVSRIGSAGLSTPPASARRSVENGRSAYIGSCAQCHGATGDGRGVFGQITYPPATDLTSESVKEKTDAQLFWMTKNGLSFTAMPGFSRQYSDSEIWTLVAFIRSLQQGGATAPNIPTPTTEQLALADPTGDSAHRGAALYFAQCCAACHGAVGNAPGDLGLGGRMESEAVRRGRGGMPVYDTTQLTDAELGDIAAYVATFRGGRFER